MASEEVFVWISLGVDTLPVGRLWFHVRNGKESSSFEYDRRWLRHPEKFGIDPLLKLSDGVFHTGGFSVFGAIGDSAPDRWGRVLMRRAEAVEARLQGKTPRTMFEIDYLLGVCDEARQGALRFSRDREGSCFLAPTARKAIPPLVELPRLLAASDRFVKDGDDEEDLRILLFPGSSLGGARPKASVRDRDGSLAIAKFPRSDDDFHVSLWEGVALTLAQRAGIQVPEWRLEEVLGKPVLLLKRFDRLGEIRLPFISAMSMLGARDGEQHSYLELAYALSQNGEAPEVDMHELWRRIVFMVMISNTDDHLRNHGFLYRQGKGWRLSPAFDLNPIPLEIKPRFLTTAIDFDDVRASIDTALSVIDEFRLTEDEARDILKEVAASVRTWRMVALEAGISKRECDRMASAFELCLP